MKWIVKTLVPVVSASLLVACFEDEAANTASPTPNPAPTSTIAVTPSLGLVMNAAAEIFAANGTTRLASEAIGDSGLLDITIEGYTGPIVAVLTATAETKYYDEALATFVSVPAGTKLHAIAESVKALAITPLTEIAYQLAKQQNAFPLTSSSVTTINNRVKSALAPSINNILTAPLLLDGSTSSIPANTSGNYALILAALAELGKDDVSGTPALAITNKLVEDLVDGKIDSKANGVDINAPYTDFINDMSAALSSAANDYNYQGNPADSNPANTDLSDAEDNGSGGNTGGNTGGNNGGDTGGDNGGDTGGDNGGDTGGDNGGDTGGDNGGDTGGDNGGDTGGDNGGVSSGGSAVACLNPLTDKAGTHVEHVYNSTNAAQGATVLTTAVTDVLGTATFKGRQATESKSVVKARSATNPEINSDSITYTYTGLTDNNTTLLVYGVVPDATTESGVTVQATISQDPPKEDRFNLTAGQSYSHSYVQTTETKSSFGGTQLPTQTITTNVVDNRTYVGRESITVPAGTFETCKFTQTTSFDGNNSGTSTTWISVDHGFFVKSVAGDTENVIVSLSINGNKVIGN